MSHVSLAKRTLDMVMSIGYCITSCQRASVLLYLGKAGYDIKLVHTDGFTRAMSQVKWSIPNPSGSTIVDLFDGPAADLLR